jgi:stearoyl-CoA desaturase (delta-9 desaturase)
MPANPLSPAIDSEGRITIFARFTAFLFVLLIPTLALVPAGWLVITRQVTLIDLWIFLGMYVATGLGVTVGYHRLFTHRAFETYRPIRYLLAFMGGMAAEGAPIIWASQHRQHHQSSDELGDPHSPHVGRKPGFLGGLRAFWHSHYGHVFNQVAPIRPEHFSPDLIEERFLRVLEKTAAIPVIAGFLIPFGIGYWATQTWQGAWTGLLWGGLVRLFVITHATGAVNSLCHLLGSRPFNTGDQSRNVWWLVPFTLGESWHNGHHAFPTSARHGLRWWELDPSWITIWFMEFFGLAWGVVRIPQNRCDEKRSPIS